MTGATLPTRRVPVWLHCPRCEVRWRASGGPDCWVCGRPGDPGQAPVTWDRQVVAAMTAREWQHVRRQVLG